eukprot:scaffold473_cov156-Amphora_coffeaeformis.AAC.11
MRLLHAVLSTIWVISVCTQDLLYHDKPHEIWRNTFNAIGEGNGVFLTPSKDKLVVVSRAGILRAYDPADGSDLWTFSPPLMEGTSFSCQSGITFVETPQATYLTYMIVDNAAGEASTRILTVSLDGTPTWESAGVPGEGAGSPRASNDGRHIAITHNFNQQGYFSIFDTESDSNEPIYQYQSILRVYEETTPFSAIGVYHSPIEGFYDSDDDNGRSNTNDIFVFMTHTNTDVLNARGDPRAGDGQMYVFQFPVSYFATQDTSTLRVIPIGTLRGYQAKTAPVLANDGLALYWNMVRGEARAWVDQRFSRGHSVTINLGRGEPAYIGGRASPTLSHDPVNYSVYGPGADAVVWKTDRFFENVTVVQTDAVVSSPLAVTLDDAFVVFGTHSGGMFWAPTSDIGNFKEFARLNPIRGDLAVDEKRIFVGDDRGNGVGQIVAFEMAYSPTPPSVAPTLAPTTVAPSHAIVTETPTMLPTPSPSITPSTWAPTRVGMIATPTLPPTMDISDDETSAPSRAANVVETSGITAWFTTHAMFFVFLGAVAVAW